MLDTMYMLQPHNLTVAGQQGKFIKCMVVQFLLFPFSLSAPAWDLARLRSCLVEHAFSPMQIWKCSCILNDYLHTNNCVATTRKFWICSPVEVYVCINFFLLH